MCVISEAQSQSHFFLTPTNDKIHLSVLNFEKQERQKEVAELEQTISGSKEELSSILHQQIAAGQEIEQSDTIDRLQEKASDLGRLERHFGREQVQSIVERPKVLEQAERAKKRPKRAFEMSR